MKIINVFIRCSSFTAEITIAGTIENKIVDLTGHIFYLCMHGKERNISISLISYSDLVSPLDLTWLQRRLVFTTCGSHNTLK